MDDVAEYNDMRNAMNVIGIDQQEQVDIFNSLAAIMWLGNVDFQEVKTETSGVTNQDTLEYVGSLLQVPIEFLSAAMTTRTVETKRGMARGTTYNVPLNVENAYSTRDALAKQIYALMFDWLVVVINRELAKHSKLSALVIGVLDIYGFEVFEHNVFEQLCINYVNEKLQQIFIEFTLRLEQEEYVREGIQWSPVNYFDNKIVCELIESKNPPGIFAILDDVCRTVHADTKGADKSFTQRLSQCTKNKHFSLRGDHFVVKHYAGDVSYEAIGMIEKNKDQLSTDVIDCMQMSENKYLNGLFASLVKSKTTAGNKIKTSANDLTKTLSQCMPHYIRCLKPNDDKQANYFDHKRVMHQVQYLGLLDNIKVRRAGFAYRTTFEKFMKRYYLISGQTSYAANKIWKGDDISGCRAILSDLPIDPGQWQLGKTKAFIKDPETLFQLEDLRQNYWHNMVGRIKAAFRTYIGFKDVCANRIKKAFRTWKVFRGGCAKIVQGCYRNYKGVSPFFQQRMDNERIFTNQKERNRLSMISVRKFYGDYLDVKQRSEIMGCMGPGASEKIIFSSKGKTVVHPGILRANKMAPRYIVLTDQALYLVALIQKKDQPPQHKLSRRIPIREITEAWLSPLVDNFVVLKVPSEFFDVVLELEFKTELISWLCLKGALQSSNVFFQDQIEYFKAKKSKNKIRFNRDEMFPDAMYKKDKVAIKGGLPASSSVAQFSKQGELVQLVHVVKEEERRPERKRERKRGANRYNDDVPISLVGVAAGTGNAGGPVAASPSPAPTPAATGPSPGAPRGGPGGPARGGPGGPRGGPGGPARGGPGRGGPARGGPGGPARGGPGGPARGGPGGPARGGPMRGGPQRGGPMRGGPQRGGPMRGGPGGPARGGPGGPQRGGPQRGGPQRGGPMRGGPARGGMPVAAAPAPAPTPAPAPVPTGPSYIGRCKTLYPYEAVEDDELTFEEGQMIDIISKDDMWWTGVLNGTEGVFPSNYVQEC